MGAVTLEVLLLRLIVRQVSLGGNIWRGVLVYVLARAFESVLFGVLPLVDRFFLGSDLNWSTVVLVLLGILIRVPLVKLTYAHKRVRWPQAVAAGILPGTASYVLLVAIECFVSF